MMGQSQRRIIYHMLPKSEWEQLSLGDVYRPSSLDNEGFIHCTGEPDRLVTVANMFYREAAGEFVILHIAEEAVDRQICWEEADGHRFPHIYGPLNLDAVVDVQRFPRAADGMFLEPGP